MKRFDVLTFGEKLKLIMENRSLKQKELAEKVNVTAAYISVLSKDKRGKNISKELISTLSEILNVSPFYFLFDFTLNDVYESGILNNKLSPDILSHTDFLPYILLIEKAYDKKIPVSTLEKIINSIIELQEKLNPNND